MEGAQSGGGAPAAAQLHILADDLFNIIAPHDFLYVFLGDHGLTAPPCQIVGAGHARPAVSRNAASANLCRAGHARPLRRSGYKTCHFCGTNSSSNRRVANSSLMPLM